VPRAPPPTDGVVIGPPAEAAGAVALSRKAEAVVFATAGWSFTRRSSGRAIRA